MMRRRVRCICKTAFPAPQARDRDTKLQHVIPSGPSFLPRLSCLARCARCCWGAPLTLSACGRLSPPSPPSHFAVSAARGVYSAAEWTIPSPLPLPLPAQLHSSTAATTDQNG
jgi:hypothetical protein